MEVSSFAQARPALPVPEEPRTTFNAALNFDAPAGDRPDFYMTVAAPSLAVRFLLVAGLCIIFAL